MTDTASPPSGPPPELRYRRRISPRVAMLEIWRARELVRSLAERELRARYKQAILGAAWAIVTPVMFMVVFTLFIKRVAVVPTNGVPYPLFIYVGLLPWTFFASSLSAGGQSLLANKVLLNKVYCPREVFPLSSVVVAAVDALTAAVPLVFLFVFYGRAPEATVLWVPVIFLVHISFTVGLTLILSSTIVYLRDVRHALAIILQVGLFASPVAYGLDSVPKSFRPLYSALNPLAPVIDGYRRALLYGKPPRWELLGVAAVTSAIFLVGGYVLFKHLETGIADVA